MNSDKDRDGTSFITWRTATPRRLWILGRTGNQLRREYRDQLSENSPESHDMVLVNDRSREIQQHALDLAKHGVPDQEAVKSITTLVGRHTYDLRIAAQALRRADRRREFADDNRAHRLLQAAINGAPVSEPSDDDAALLNMLAQFRARPLAEQYRALAAAQPSLGQLADELGAGGWTMPRKDPSGGAPLTRAQQQQVEQTVAVFKRLRDLVGPHANTDDPLLRSGTAAAAARKYLTEAAQRRA